MGSEIARTSPFEIGAMVRYQSGSDRQAGVIDAEPELRLRHDGAYEWLIPVFYEDLDEIIATPVQYLTFNGYRKTP